MRIPNRLTKPRYFVVANNSRTEAHSSWGTLEEARKCVRKFQKYYPAVFRSITGILEVSNETIIEHSKTGGDDAT